MDAFKAVCDRAGEAPEAKASELGALMDASHASCSKLYECRRDDELQERGGGVEGTTR